MLNYLSYGLNKIEKELEIKLISTESRTLNFISLSWKLKEVNKTLLFQTEVNQDSIFC